MRLPRVARTLLFASLVLWPVASIAGPQELVADAPQARRNFFPSFSASSLVGKPVTNSEWKHVARVEQVMIDPKDGRVTFVVLSFVDREGFFAIPWSALAIQERGQLHLPMDVARLENTVRLHGSHGSFLSRTGEAGSQGPKAELGSEYNGIVDDKIQTSFVQDESEVLAGVVAGVVTAPFEERTRSFCCSSTPAGSS